MHRGALCVKIEHAQRAAHSDVLTFNVCYENKDCGGNRGPAPSHATTVCNLLVWEIGLFVWANFHRTGIGQVHIGRSGSMHWAGRVVHPF